MLFFLIGKSLKSRYTQFVREKKESQNVEWKTEWKDDNLKCLSAFANTEGGRLYVGINDHGQVVKPLKNAHKLLEDIPNKIRNMLGIIADVRLMKEKGAEFLCVEVPAYNCLISYKGRYYYRSGSTTQELAGEDLERMFMQRQNLNWDAVTIPGVSIDVLSEYAFRLFRMKCAKVHPNQIGTPLDDKETILRNLQLITDKGELTRAAILLFHPQPERFFFGATVRVAFFSSESDIEYQDEFSGPLFEQVDRLEDTIYTKYMKATISYDGFQRIEKYPIPRPVLREAILNAVVHRDYSSGNSIQIKIFKDQVALYNPGKLPKNWTVEDLTKRHYSCPFNPLIAGAFTSAGEIEKWGRGIQTMMRLCGEEGLPMPKYRFKDGFELTFHTLNASSASPKKRSTQDAIIALIRENPAVSRAQMAEKLGLSLRSIAYHLKNLRKDGILIRSGSDKNGKWVVEKKR